MKGDNSPIVAPTQHHRRSIVKIRPVKRPDGGRIEADTYHVAVSGDTIAANRQKPIGRMVLCRSNQTYM